MFIGIGTRCSEDAKKCACSFHAWPNVSEVGSTTKGDYSTMCYHLFETLLSLNDVNISVTFFGYSFPGSFSV